MLSESSIKITTQVQKTFTPASTLRGVIYSKDAADTYTVKTSNGIITLKINSAALSPGDQITIKMVTGQAIPETVENGINNAELVSIDKYTQNQSQDNKLLSTLNSLNLSLLSKSREAISSNYDSLSKLVEEYKKSLPIENSTQIQTVIAEIEKTLSAGEFPDDALKIKNLLDNIKALVSTTLQRQPGQFTLPARPGIQEGIYTFQTLQSALEFLNSEGKSLDLKAHIESELSNYKQILIKITSSFSNNIFSASIVPKIFLPREISLFIDNLSSSPMKSLPFESWENILMARGSLPLDTLRKIDIMLTSSNAMFPAERAGSNRVSGAVATQWLANILDISTIQKNPEKYIPNFPASKMVTDIEALGKSLEMHSGKKIEVLTSTGLTEHILETPNRSSVISSVVSSLGYNLESRLFHNTISKNSTDLKSLLIQLLHSTTEPYLDSVPVSGSRQTSDSERILHSLSESLKTIQKDIKQLVNFQTKEDTGIQLLQQIKNSSVHIDSLYDSILQFSIKNGTALLSKNFINQLESIIQLLKATGIIQTNAMTPELSRHLTAASDAIGKFSELLFKHKLVPDEMPRDNHSFEPASEEPDRAIHTQSSLRQTIESALGKLESLQLLARQVPVSDGQQQIIAIPMKIENEWTEVNIRFLKQKNSSKKKHGSSTTFSVYLNLSPRVLGDISIKMEYIQKKSLKVYMDFENNSTLNYFNQFRDGLQSAIKELGLPLTSVDLKRKNKDQSVNNTVNSELIIDVKV